MFGIPSFGLGPGNEEYAHSPKEHIPVDHLVKAAAFYAAFAEQYSNAG
jgi:acetylornithine deacetylase/succinyl-diaminopimelate desuccinylase-like protein